ncbi:relaxin receptor 1-like [Uloborus diversus]|uniref:relaxin receptor 1-like n=1 Tax=Uloborus diversus TaxID=327109 RepID=UPI00240A57DB|nr:relaxin receptor 1-like [Uloborus diversus]XP_054715668.1 relaxin receptor 1-like [Uloborus diversus]
MLLHFFILLFMSFHVTHAALQVGSASIQDLDNRCPHGQFPCNSSDTCVEQRKNCDGHNDCEDGSDEMGCEDPSRKEFYNNMFMKRPDEDREKRVEGCELEETPNPCRCSGFKLFCDHLNLSEPPVNLPENLQELDLSGNNLDILKPSHFKPNEHLEVLILKGSEVNLVSKDAFINLPNLRTLYLTKNSISAIIDGSMATNKHLTYLELSYNPLRTIAPGAFEGLINLQRLDLRNCCLRSLHLGVFDSLVNLKILFLDDNKLNNIPENLFQRLENLEMLSLSRNELTSSHMASWFGLQKLKSLAISQNLITELDGTSFGNMSHLHKLDLHENRIKTIQIETFVGLPNLQSLNLKMKELKKLTKAVFKPLGSLEYIYFDDFHLCSLALHVRVCEPRGDGISSIAHLLDSVVLRVSVWGVAVVAGLGNLAVLVGRLLLSEPNEVHSFYIKNLSLADLLMAAYLFVIAGYDLAFRGEYIHHEARWRHSWQCSLCGFLSTLSSEASILILAVITTDRYMSIIYPLSVKKRTLQSAAAAMGTAWGVAALFSALPLLNIEYYGDEFYGNNGVCLPLHIHDPFGQAWEYSTFLFCGLNFAAFLFILFAYISMFFTISHSKIGLRCTQQQQDRNIAKRFAFIVATDFLCWVPIVFIKVIAMGGVPIQEDLYAWVAVFLLPVNSAINPVLYTLTTKLFKQHLAKMVYNFKNSTGDSVTPSCARNHSLRSQKGSFSQADHNNIALVMNRNCFECRHSNGARQKGSSDFGACRRHSSKRTTVTNVV